MVWGSVIDVGMCKYIFSTDRLARHQMYVCKPSTNKKNNHQQTEKASLQNFPQLQNRPKNRRWRRCCATGMHSMRQPLNTHWNRWGYDWIRLAAALWHHTAPLGCRKAALGCHTATLSQPQDTLTYFRGSETVTLYCCTSSVIAATWCLWLLTIVLLHMNLLWGFGVG